MNSEKLADLSNEALIALAEKLELDLPQDLPRSMAIEEIIEALNEDDEDRRESLDAPVRVEGAKYSGSELDAFEASLDAAPCIPIRYNETVLHALPRDPAWAFAFWDISDEERSCIENGEGIQNVFLRVTEQADDGQAKATHFDISINPSDSQWYVNLPAEDAAYRMELCVRSGSKMRVLARSALFRTPRSAASLDATELSPEARALLESSGADRSREDAYANPCRLTSSESL